MSGSTKTLIVSDLHLGNGGMYDIFAGGETLPSLLRRFAAPGHTVICNGDGVDFLMNEDPLELDETRAVTQAEQICQNPVTQRVLHAIGDVLAAGGDVVIRLGNHDIELALPGVQATLRAHLGQPAAVSQRLQFQRGNEPALLDVGGARILVTHGEQNDEWNKVDYPHLPGPGAPRSASAESFRYAAGSKLVKTIMNPLKRAYRLKLIDLIKPDFQGGVLTALAVSPQAVKEVFKGSTLDLLLQLRQSKSGPATFGPDDEDELGLAKALSEAQLTSDEQETLAALLSDGTDQPESFAFDSETLSSLQLKLAKAGLAAYAKAQRKLTGAEGQQFFAFAPDESEWNEAKRLAQKYSASAVVFGHTHAARFQQQDGLAYLNTGTWIRLISLPAPDASDEEWTNFLSLARRNPQLDPSKGKMVPILTRFTAAVLESLPSGGASLQLVELLPSGQLHVHAQGQLPSQGAKP